MAYVAALTYISRIYVFGRFRPQLVEHRLLLDIRLLAALMAAGVAIVEAWHDTGIVGAAGVGAIGLTGTFGAEVLDDLPRI